MPPRTEQRKLLLLLALAAALSDPALAFRRQECSTDTPVCRSDRFDVVFSHKDEWNCKVFKCKCKEPTAKTCAQGQARLQVDVDGCQYYDCQSCPVQPVCQGSQVSNFRGNDAAGCPLYVCECNQNPVRPPCGANQQLQPSVDSSGCPVFACQQTRAQCPNTPTCSTNQQLASVGLVGDCQIYKCECLTPAKVACSIGSQARLQDDGLGCQVYRCQENRSPCPPEPTCSSSHQMVTQNGVDGNNCIKYVCKCIPLAPVSCPSGFLQTLATDDSCGCQYYKCDANCEQKPNCPSVYQDAVITGTRNNGCPTYSCQCKNPEVISCTLADAHLVLSKATDGTNCDVYVCQTGNSNTRSCANVPSCPVGQSPVLSSYDSQGCPVYLCRGGSGGGTTCPGAPRCGTNELQQVVGRDISGCPQYVCYRLGCTAPPNCGNQQAVVNQYTNTCPVYVCQDSRSCPVVPTCPLGQVSFQVGYLNGAGSCPQYVCQPVGCPPPTICPANQSPNYVTVSSACVSVTCGSSRSCQGVPTCRPGETPQVTGTDSLGCTRYVCYRLGCPSPPLCPPTQVVSTSFYDASNCAMYTCQNDNGCQAPITCLPSETQMYIGQGANGCPEYLCQRAGCTPPPTCTYGERLVSAGASGGCPLYTCQSSTRSCPVQPTCPAGQTPSVVGYDSSSCPVFSCPTDTSVCAAAQQLTNCPLGQTPISSGTDAFGCPVYVCQFTSRSCPYPPVCLDGRAASVSGRDANNCPIYGACFADSGLGRAGVIGGVGGIGVIGGVVGGVGGIVSGIGGIGGIGIGGIGIGGVVRDINGLPLVGTASSCPQQPDCQYQQLRIRSQDAQPDGRVCDRYTCINLGDYTGRPPKCHDNPTYCDVSQTVETYMEHGSRKPCQRVVCKASGAFDSLVGGL